MAVHSELWGVGVGEWFEKNYILGEETHTDKQKVEHEAFPKGDYNRSRIPSLRGTCLSSLIGQGNFHLAKGTFIILGRLVGKFVEGALFNNRQRSWPLFNSRSAIS